MIEAIHPVVVCSQDSAGFAKEGAVLVVSTGEAVLMQRGRKNPAKGILTDGVRAFPSETLEGVDEPGETAVARILREEHGIEDVQKAVLRGRFDRGYFPFPFPVPNGHTPPVVWRAHVFVVYTSNAEVEALHVRRPTNEVLSSELISWQEVMDDAVNPSARSGYRQIPSTLAIAEHVYRRGLHIPQGNARFILHP